MHEYRRVSDPSLLFLVFTTCDEIPPISGAIASKIFVTISNTPISTFFGKKSVRRILVFIASMVFLRLLVICEKFQLLDTLMTFYEFNVGICTNLISLLLLIVNIDHLLVSITGSDRDLLAQIVDIIPGTLLIDILVLDIEIAPGRILATALILLVMILIVPSLPHP